MQCDRRFDLTVSLGQQVSLAHVKESRAAAVGLAPTLQDRRWFFGLFFILSCTFQEDQEKRGKVSGELYSNTFVTNTLG